MFTLSNKELLTGIVNQKPKVLNFLYRKLFPKVKGMILNMGGSYDDANDIFQEAIVVLYKQFKQKRYLKEDVNVLSYILGTCRILWIKHYRKRITRIEHEYSFALGEDDFTPDVETEIINDYKESIRQKLYYKHFTGLKEDCQKILKAFYQGKPPEEIATELGYSSVTYVRRRKYLCKEFLVKSIKSDPDFKDIMDIYDEE